jgi:glutamate-1-semialdehyde 2,1-aminomutase
MFTQDFVNTLPMESSPTPAVGRAPAQAPAGGALLQHTLQNQNECDECKLSEREQWFARAAAVMPYGVSSNFRYWGDADTMIVRKAQGAYLWDVDGKKYIDYRLGFGPVILGHAFPAVTQAVAEAMTDGNTFALTHIYEVQAAERFVRMTNTDMVRWTNSGAESTLHAIRVARAHTNRDKLIKFEGSYHGAHDYVMWSTPNAPLSALGSAKAPRAIASSSGIPNALNGMTLTLPYNDFEMLEKTVKDKHGDIAAIIVEPIMGNLAATMPAKGWLQHIRRLCNEYGIVMILDEVKTGFRIAPGGAQQFFGVKADLVTYAKAMGNGFPIGAIAGKREFMMTIQPGAVGQGGTYCGNVVSAAACDATLKFIEDNDVFGVLTTRGTQLMVGIHEILTRHQITHALTGVPSLFGVLIGTETPLADYRASKRVDDVLSRKINDGLRAQGVLVEPDYQEPWFLSYSHSERDVDETLEIFERVIASVK